MGEAVDWSFAQSELLEKQGVDLRKEMSVKLKEMEERFRREKQESDKRFEQDRREYEFRISSLQEQVRVTSRACNLALVQCVCWCAGRDVVEYDD